jgi:hypothetical protein
VHLRTLAEAGLLGLASGPACLASCGAVLVPALAAGGRGYAGTTGLLGQFLAGRLAGYLCFAVVAWLAGAASPAGAGDRALLFGLVDLGLALMLAAYALSPREKRAEAEPPLVQIGGHVRPAAPAVLGLLAGLNICPPFVAAGARAAESASLAGAVIFFVVFFLGTAVWTLPLAGIGWARRRAEVATVARIAMLLVAGWYLYRAAIALAWRFAHGR